MKTKFVFLVLMLFASLSMSATGWYTNTPITISGYYDLTDGGTLGTYEYNAFLLSDGVAVAQSGWTPTSLGAGQWFSFTMNAALWVPDPLTKTYYTIQVVVRKTLNGTVKYEDGTTYCDVHFMALPLSLTGLTEIPISF